MSVNKRKERNLDRENSEFSIKGLQLRWLRDRDELYELFGNDCIPHLQIIDRKGNCIESFAVCINVKQVILEY